ncbi:hypothetical protein SpCBS45565_g01070 [Spizellomyces sp. 'palustris']|nr:hypothetical protein SpCBS45565_g01070 [Spizellomyces sp. 'palustris']
MAEFLGMDVRLYLNNGLLVDGRVANIDQRTQLLTLLDASTVINGVQQRFPSYPVPGQDIKDLQILPVSTPPPPEPPLPTPPQPHHHYSPTPNALHPYPPQIQHILSTQSSSIEPPRAGRLPQPPQSLLHPQQPSYQHVQHVELPKRPDVQPPATRPFPSNFIDPAIVSLSQAAPSQQNLTRKASHGVLDTPPTMHRSPSLQTPPRIDKTPSQGSLDRRSQLHAITTKQAPFSPPAAAITVTESEFDEEEVDFSDFTRLNIQDFPARVNGRAKGTAARKDGNRVRTSGKQQGRLRHESQSPGTRSRRGRRGEAFAGDVSNFSDDFDFQAGLSQFDKHRVFAEIRQADSTAPETLLVNLNRTRNQAPGMQKLGIRDMVLDSLLPSGDETGNDAEVESDNDSDGLLIQGSLTGEMGILRDAVLLGRRRLCKTISGVIVPSVTPAEMIEIERIAACETGPSDEQMIENGGRGVAMMVLQALGGNRRIKPGNHNDGPVVVVLVGNNKLGAFGLCAARHLANHECNVIVSAVGSDAELVNAVATQQKIYLPTGGKLTRGVVDLPHPSSQPVDLIIDALFGSYQTLLDLSEHDKSLVCDLMKWANDNKANVLSLDVASGVNGVTGLPMSPAHYVRPKWTLALGLPKSGHLRASREITGELFLADLGIPRVVFQKVNKSVAAGRVKYIPPFGDKFLVGLEVVDGPTNAV